MGANRQDEISHYQWVTYERYSNQKLTEFDLAKAATIAYASWWDQIIIKIKCLMNDFDDSRIKNKWKKIPKLAN